MIKNLIALVFLSACAQPIYRRPETAMPELERDEWRDCAMEVQLKLEDEKDSEYWESNDFKRLEDEVKKQCGEAPADLIR